MVRVGLSPDSSSLLIRFEYDPRLVELTKQLPGRRFHRGFCGWLAPLTPELVAELPGRYPGAALQVDQAVHDRLNRLKKDALLTTTLKKAGGRVDLPQEMVFPNKQPLDHQRLGLKLFMERPKFGYFMEMGTGKTFVILGGLRWLKANQLLRPTLIVAPSSVLHVWEDQAKEHQPDLRVKALVGSVAQRKAQLQEGYVAGTEVFILNYEAVWRMAEELKAIPWKCIVLDESTRIKNRTSKQTKAILKLGAQIPRRYILTGTPVPNSPLELYSQLYFLDPGILGNHFYAFRDRYAVMGGYQGYQVVSWRNLTELMGKLNQHSYRVLKKDCLDLPEKVYEAVRLDLEGDQREAYVRLSEDLVTEVQEQQVTAAVLVTKLIKLREILAGFVKCDDGSIKVFKQQAKLAALEDLVEGMPPAGKMIIWCQFHEEMRLIREFFLNKLGQQEGNLALLDGSTPQAQRKLIIDRFQQEPKCRFFIGQQKAGGLGISLTAAQYAVFMTNDYSPEVRLQAEDRCHRMGQKNQVTYYDLVCKSTVDVVTRATLRRKMRLADLLTGENFASAVRGEEW